MGKISLFLALLLFPIAVFADTKISQLPLGSAAASGANDPFPYVDLASGATKRMKLSDLVNLPAFTTGYNAPTCTQLATLPTGCTAGQFATAMDRAGNFTCATPSGTGSVTTVSVATANGFAGTVANPTTTPALTLSTTVTGITKGNGTSLSAAVAGTDYENPLTFSSPLLRSTNTISCQVATGLVPGCLSAADWTTFNGKQGALSFGNLTAAGTDGIAVTGGTGAVIGSGASIAQQAADSTHNGYLTSTDWSTFNGKQAAGNYITGLTGDVTASGPGSVAATIANSAVTNAKMADMATQTFKGRTTAGTGAPEDLTATQATALLNAMVGDSGSGGTKGLVPAPGAGDAAGAKFLKADGTWAVPAGGGGGTSIVSPLEELEKKAEAEHFGIFTDPTDNSVASGFNKQPGANYNVQGVLLENYTASSGTAKLVWSPYVLRSADKNTDSTTNWSAVGSAGAPSTSATLKIGSASLSFGLTAATTGGIKYDYGSATFGVNGYSNLYFWVNLGTVTNLTNVYVKIDQDGTNTATYNLTTDYAGNALASGWNLMFVNLATATPSSTGGTGWTNSLPFRYFHVGVTYSASTTATTLVDAVLFGLTHPEHYMWPGMEATLYNGTNSDVIVFSSANTQMDGGAVALSTTSGNNHSAGFGASHIARSTLGVSTAYTGSNQALMVATDQFDNSLAGVAITRQEARLARNLRTALASNTVQAFVDVNTPQVYEINSVTGTTVVVADASDTHNDLLSGETIECFSTTYIDGVKNFIFTGSGAMTSNSSASSGATTLNFSGGIPTGCVAGGYAAKHHPTVSLSAVAGGSAESYSAMSLISSPDGVLLYDSGFPIPNAANVVGYWTLGGTSPYTNLQGPMNAVTQSGTLTNSASFKQGQYATTGTWSTSNYLKLPGSAAYIGGGANGTFSISLWYYPVTNSASGTSFMSCYSNAASNGWGMDYVATNTLRWTNSSTGIQSGGTVLIGQWNHIVFNWATGGAYTIWLNGAQVMSGTQSLNADTVDCLLGANSSGPSIGLGAGDRFAQLVAWTGVNLNAAQVAQLYNSGLAQILGFGPRVKYRYQATGVSGQQIGIKASMSRDTTAVAPFVTKMGVIKVNLNDKQREQLDNVLHLPLRQRDYASIRQVAA